MAPQGMTDHPRLRPTSRPGIPWNEQPMLRIGQNIRVQAARAQVKQSDLCRMLAAGQYRVRRVMSGHPGMSMTLALSIAQVLGMTYADVFDGLLELD